MGLTQGTEGVNVTFKEHFYMIIECIKNEPYFQWLGKIGGEPTRRNQSLYCSYHREKGHTTKQCHVLMDHLEQLVKLGHFKEFLVGQEGVSIGQGSRNRSDHPFPPALVLLRIFMQPL